MKEKVNRKVNEVRHWFFEQPTKLIKFSRFTKKQTRITNTRNEKKKKKEHIATNPTDFKGKATSQTNLP